MPQVTVVKSRKYMTAQEKAELKRAEREGMVSQKVKVGPQCVVPSPRGLSTGRLEAAGGAGGP